MPRRSSAWIAKARSRGVKTCAATARRHVVKPPGQHVGQDVEPAHEVELLEDHRAIGAPGAQLLALELGDVGVAEQDLALGRVDQAVQKAQQRGFPGAGTADDADHLAVGDGEVGVVDGEVVAEAAGQLFEFQHGCPLMRCHGRNELVGPGPALPLAPAPKTRARGRCTRIGPVSFGHRSARAGGSRRMLMIGS
jgi:hypothetical protein